MTIKFGKGLWVKIPADGTTVVTKPVLKGRDEQGKNTWEDTASKLTPEKTPKAKSKTRKGPEL